ncbi:MAG: hypothetical protein ACI9VS_003192, partial [Candidatus Binatia bacterium]
MLFVYSGTSAMSFVEEIQSLKEAALAELKAADDLAA